MADTTGNGLTDRQERFALEYLVDFNGTRAAIRAGYAESGAHVTASQLIRNPKVLEIITEKGQQTADELGMTRGYVYSKLQETLEKAVAGAPKFHKDQPLYDTEGNLVIEINAGAVKSLLELLAKLRGDLDDKVKHEGEVRVIVSGAEDV